MFFTIPISKEPQIATTPIGAKSVRYIYFENKNDGIFNFKANDDVISISIDGKQICRNLIILPFCTNTPYGTNKMPWQKVALEANLNVDFSEVKLSAATENDYNVVLVCSDEAVDEAKGFDFFETKKIPLKTNITLNDAYIALRNAYKTTQQDILAKVRSEYGNELHTYERSKANYENIISQADIDYKEAMANGGQLASGMGALNYQIKQLEGNETTKKEGIKAHEANKPIDKKAVYAAKVQELQDALTAKIAAYDKHHKDNGHNGSSCCSVGAMLNQQISMAGGAKAAFENTETPESYFPKALKEWQNTLDTLNSQLKTIQDNLSAKKKEYEKASSDISKWETQRDNATLAKASAQEQLDLLVAPKASDYTAKYPVHWIGVTNVWFTIYPTTEIDVTVSLFGNKIEVKGVTEPTLLSRVGNEDFMKIITEPAETMWGNEQQLLFDKEPQYMFAYSIVKPKGTNTIMSSDIKLNISIVGAAHEVIPPNTDLDIFSASDHVPFRDAMLTFDPSDGVKRSLSITVNENSHSNDGTHITKLPKIDFWTLYMLFGYKKII